MLEDAGRSAEADDGGRKALIALLIRDGYCDANAIERARRIAEESGQHLDTALSQLGLVTERDLAGAYARLLNLPLAGPSRYPAAPLWADQLPLSFLRSMRALPLADESGTLVLGVADPLDRFIPEAVAAAVLRPVRSEVCVPIELEQALERLYPEQGSPAPDEIAETTAAPLEEDTERLRDLASEAPVIRLVNQIIARAVETQASDIHIEPFEGRLRLRYRYDGVLH